MAEVHWADPPASAWWPIETEYRSNNKALAGGRHAKSIQKMFDELPYKPYALCKNSLRELTKNQLPK